MSILSTQTAHGDHRVQLLPAGEFRGVDGRPGPGKSWHITAAGGYLLAAALNAIAASTPISIDYEHQTLLARTNGQPAPAAGWIEHTEWAPGEGLFARVKWTKRALGHIRAGEYGYISPVILADQQTGAITGLHNAALVSQPALIGMASVWAGLATSPRTVATTVADARPQFGLKVWAYRVECLAAGVYINTLWAMDHVTGTDGMDSVWGQLAASPRAAAAATANTPEQFALKVRAYQAECLAADVYITTLQAMDHVLGAEGLPSTA